MDGTWYRCKCEKSLVEATMKYLVRDVYLYYSVSSFVML